MRLIDADKLENFAHEESFGTYEMIQDWIYESDLAVDIKIDWEDQLVDLCWKVLEGCMNIIRTEPTAYDIETVVTMLEDSKQDVSRNTTLGECFKVGFKKAINEAIETIRYCAK